MKKISFVLFSIILLSCNGNNSVRNQETLDADSIATVDTTVTPPMEEKTTPKEESKTINKVSKNRKSGNQIAGIYYCRKSGDRYILNHDYSGVFLPKAGETCTIEWYKTGNTVSVTFTGEMAFLGTQILNYAEEGHFLIEKSEIYGYLKYTKQ